MAKIFPNEWRELNNLLDFRHELATLKLLEKELNDQYSVYHGVHWTKIDSKNHAIFGEIDFAVVAPSGKLLLIEQKNGPLEETNDGLEKHYRDGSKNVPFQISRNADALHHRLKQFCANKTVYVDSLLYCPDYRVKKTGSAGIAPDRIVDSTRAEKLVDIILNILPAADPVLVSRESVHHFLSDLLQIEPVMDEVVGQADTVYTRISDGLATWAQRLELHPHRLRVVGTAGSGKTQLAVSVYRKAIREGRLPLYVCYNRPLADHMSKIAPPGGVIATYHHLGKIAADKAGSPIDFTKSNPFLAIDTFMSYHTPPTDSLFDELVVDEGQDFHTAWLENLIRWVKPNGKIWWMEDPMQNVYDRVPAAPKDWACLRSDTNYRSPRRLMEQLNQLLGLNPPIEAGGLQAGEEISLFVYKENETQDLFAKTVQALNLAHEIGYEKSHTALVTYRGRENSAFTPFDRIGGYTLRAPTGRYTAEGHGEYSDGDITVDSVQRFKGRTAPCVVLTEIDFDVFDEKAKRRIFVGATRATMKLVLVISERGLGGVRSFV